MTGVRQAACRRPGTRALAMAAGLLLGAPALADPVRVGIDFPAGGGPVSPVLVCAARGLSASQDVMRCKQEAAATGAEAWLDLEVGDWTLSARAEGFWSAPADITVGEPPDGTRLALWPAATLSGALLGGPGSVIPAVVEVRLMSAAGPETARLPPLAGTLRCPVEGDRWRCAAPAAALDLEVRPEGYVPHYAWGVTLVAGQETFLGGLELRRAASVAGWIAAADGSPPRAPCQARVSEAAALVGSAAPGAGSGASALSDPRGFFQIVGAPPGEAQLTLECAGRERATRAVDILPDRETRLPRPLVPLDLIIVPWRDPLARPWKVDVFALHDRKEVAVGEAASPEGRWFRQRVVAAEYEVNVANAEGAYFLHKAVDARERRGPVTLRVPILEIAGIVQIEGRPISADVTFSDEAAMLASRVPVERMPEIKVRSGDDGEFQTFVPASADALGRGWTVAVHADRPPVSQTLEHVFPSERRPGDVAWFELALPAASVRGIVLSADGRPEPRVQVRAESLDSRWDYHDATTDEGGAFQFVGLPPGPYRVSVEGSFAPQDVDVAEGVEQELQFVNRPLGALRGRILGGGQPLAGAWVHVWRAPGVLQGSYITGADGRFEVATPGDAPELGLTVRASGYAFKMMRWVRQGRDLVELDLDTAVGKLVLDIPPEPPDQGRGLVVLAHNQTLEAIEILKAWASENGGGEEGDRLVMPNVEPGDYALCRVAPREAQALWDGELPRDLCSGRERLDAGGTLVLELPEGAAGR